MASVFLLEDDTITLEHLVDKVNSCDGFNVVATARTLEVAEACLEEHDPDVLLVDLQLPDGESFDLIHKYTDTHPGKPIMVISVFGDEDRVVRAISAGARGYLLKDDTGTQIGHALAASLNGQSPISPAIATHLVNYFINDDTNHSKQQDEIENPLSKRELEVLQLAAKGLSYREVAELLEVSVSTIGTYTMRIYTKLAVNSRVEALYEARKLGLMPD